MTSKNYLNALHFKMGKGKKKFSWNSGFYASMGYEPWNGDWRYGYSKGSGRYADFVSTRIYTIPNLNNLFFNVGVFVGFGN